MIKLVIFDLGETLIFYNGIPLNWGDNYKAAITMACNTLSIGIDEKLLDKAASLLYKYNTRINPRSEEFTSDIIFKDVLHLLNIDPTIYNKFIKAFFRFFQRKAQLEETAIELLCFLRDNNIHTAVLTDVPYGMPKAFVLEDLNSILSYIDIVLTSTEVGLRKPETTGIKILLNKFDCNSKSAVMVGNEKKDVDTAIASQVMPVLLSKEIIYPKLGQSATISKLIDLKNYL